jgi:hypothetical protein
VASIDYSLRTSLLAVDDRRRTAFLLDMAGGGGLQRPKSGLSVEGALAHTEASWPSTTSYFPAQNS